MTRRLIIRTVLFLLIAGFVWAGSAGIEVATRTDPATPTAPARPPANDPENFGAASAAGAAGESRYEDLIAFGGAVLVVVAFGLTIGSCRRQVGMAQDGAGGTERDDALGGEEIR